MMSLLQLKPIHPKTATQAEFVALNQFANRMQAEYFPEDPPRTVEETMANWQSIPPFVEVHLWSFWDGNLVVALADAEVARTKDNQHLVWCEIEVLPEYRRRGLARRLLALVADVAQKEKRSILITSTDSAIPAGEAFLKRLGARPGMHSRTNQLALADLDRELMRRWQGQAPMDKFLLGLWEGAFPETEIDAIVAMKNAIVNTMPRENLELEDRQITKEEVRQKEVSLAKRKVIRWTMYAKHRATGELAGYTEVFWEVSQPETLRQGDTGVYPKYREHGLGRWLKAAMIERVLRERPQVKRIRTGNANSNAPMLKINYELGFKPYKDWTTWQVELGHVLEYLNQTKE
jgi:GNAT superfamily N-acetyltransferase